MWENNESVLGLDIEAQGIKVVELKKTTAGIELVRAQILSLPADSLKDGVVIVPKSIATAVKDFIAVNNILAKKAVVVINPSLALIRLLRVPFMSEAQIRDILEAEANQYVDFKNKEKVVDFCLLEEINEEGIKKVNVLFAAALKEVIYAFIRVAEEANLELTGIDVANLAVIRALYEVNIKPSSLEPVMLVTVNPTDIQLCILKNNRPRFLHTVKIDAQEFMTARKGFIDRLIFSMKLVLNYYSRAIHGQEEIKNIILGVNEPSLKDVDKELTPELEGLSLEKANPLGRLKVDNAVFSQSVKEDISLSFTQAIGAALRMEDAADYPLSLNLLPLERQKRLLMNKELTLYASSLAIILTTFIVLAGIFWLNNRLMQGRINILNKQLEEITPSLDKLIREYSKNVDLDQRISEGSQIITEANSKSTFSSGFLAEVMVLVPEGLWLTDISGQLKEHSLIFVGNALEEKAIFEYVDNLTKTGYFSKVEPIFSEIQEKTLQFLIKCQLKI